MKTGTTVLIVFLLVSGILGAFAAIHAGDAQADITRYVKVGGDGDGTSWLTASGTPQNMIDEVEATGGGMVCVASGAYTPTFTNGGTSPRHLSFRMRNNVGIYGGFPNTGSPTWADRNWKTYQTVLSGEIGNPGTISNNCYHVFYNSGTLNATAIIDGFTITGGNANGASPHNAGGGMFNYASTSPSITNCIFDGNNAKWMGGGMFNGEGASPIVTGCIFTNNLSGSSGGGMQNLFNNSSLNNCVFEHNQAIYGAGIANIMASPLIDGCTFSNQIASQFGGAINIVGAGSSTFGIVDCIFENNVATCGGAIAVEDASPVLVNSTFMNNSAFYGGGVYNRGYWSECLTVITNCTFYDNMSGWAIYNRAYLPSGGSCLPQITNCVVWENTGSGIENSSASPSVTYCAIQGGYEGVGNISGTPMFVNPGSGDFHLQDGSPCIDSGSNAAILSTNITSDFDGNARIIGGTVDMGADEFWSPWNYDADLDGNISKQEALEAVTDFFSGLITKQQALEVIVLFFNNDYAGITAIRHLPDSVKPGELFSVKVTTNLFSGAIQEKLPSGFFFAGISNISAPCKMIVRHCEITNVLESLYLGGIGYDQCVPQKFSYKIVAASNIGSYAFSGTLTAIVNNPPYKTEHPVDGYTEILVQE